MRNETNQRVCRFFTVPLHFYWEQFMFWGGGGLRPRGYITILRVGPCTLTSSGYLVVCMDEVLSFDYDGSVG